MRSSGMRLEFQPRAVVEENGAAGRCAARRGAASMRVGFPVVGICALVVLLPFLMVPSPALGEEGPIVGTTWTGEPGITETVNALMLREALAPDLSSKLRETHKEEEADLERKTNPFSPKASR